MKKIKARKKIIIILVFIGILASYSIYKIVIKNSYHNNKSNLPSLDPMEKALESGHVSYEEPITEGGQRHKINIDSNGFSVKSLTAQVNDRIIFTNEDKIDHEIVSDKPVNEGPYNFTSYVMRPKFFSEVDLFQGNKTIIFMSKQKPDYKLVVTVIE